MSIHKRLEKLENHRQVTSNVHYPTMPPHKRAQAVSIICQLFEIGVLPDNPPPHWTPEQLGYAKRVKELMDIAHKRKEANS